MGRFREKQCLHCGRPEHSWQDSGHDSNNQSYCCRGCAEEYLCTCSLNGYSERLEALDFNH